MGPEVFIVLGIAVLIFGSARLPKLARSVGEAKSEFERGRAELPSNNVKESANDD
jgi:sec-independent protein translocase protein TatA